MNTARKMVTARTRMPPIVAVNTTFDLNDWRRLLEAEVGEADAEDEDDEREDDDDIPAMPTRADMIPVFKAISDHDLVVLAPYSGDR